MIHGFVHAVIVKSKAIASTSLAEAPNLSSDQKDIKVHENSDKKNHNLIRHLS